MPLLPVVLDSDIPGLTRVSRGKVRDMYDAGEHLLIVATDRISAFDVVLPNGIPGKGQVLTALSLFWFEKLRDVVPNHLVTADLARMPDAVRRQRATLDGRTILVRKAKVYPVECVVRGYLAGSGWKDYRATGAVCGVKLPPGLRESEKLPDLIFTPATKAEEGHDENISFSRMVETVGRATAERLREASLGLYTRAADYARSRGILLADTKFEFGEVDGKPTLIDEALTPDSSRFWPADRYAPGKSQPSYDKQFVRDWLDGVKWNHSPPAPALPQDVVRGTSAKYLEALTLLTGRSL